MTASAGQRSDGLGRLVTDFVQRVAGVAHAVVVGPDRTLTAASDGLPPDRAQQLGAMAAGLMRMARDAALSFKGGEVAQTMIEMELGYLYLMSLQEGSCLAVLASPRCELGTVAYEMAVLVERIDATLTPAPPQRPREKGDVE